MGVQKLFVGVEVVAAFFSPRNWANKIERVANHRSS